jgi:glycosyltransferase involved in cell wall biosynthesis
LNNILFIDAQPKKLIRNYFSLCDVTLIHLKNSKVFSKVIPSKLFESMGMGIPTLMSIPEGEATKIVSDFECGVIIPPEDGRLLAINILELKSSKKNLNKLRLASEKASFNFSRDNKALEMFNILRDLSKK